MCGRRRSSRLDGMTTSTSTPEAGYHLLLRSQARYRWWRPLVVGLTAVGLYAAVLLAVLIAVVIVGLAVPSLGAAIEQGWTEEMDLGNPMTFALLLGSLILMLPALLVATRLAGAHPIGLLSSVTGRLRSRWLATATLTAFAVWVPTMAAWIAVEAAAGTLQVRQVAPATTFALLVLTLALVPLQAAAEEYVFRGYLAQLVGSWLRHPAFAVLLPVPLFVLGHGYGALGAVDVAAFALMGGWLAWRTGGLEAPIAAHIANNVVLMFLSALGLGDPNATDTSALGLVVSTGMMAVFTLVIARRADSLEITRTRRLPLSSQQMSTPVQATNSQLQSS